MVNSGSAAGSPPVRKQQGPPGEARGSWPGSDGASGPPGLPGFPGGGSGSPTTMRWDTRTPRTPRIPPLRLGVPGHETARRPDPQNSPDPRFPLGVPGHEAAGRPDPQVPPGAPGPSRPRAPGRRLGTAPRRDLDGPGGSGRGPAEAAARAGASSPDLVGARVVHGGGGGEGARRPGPLARSRLRKVTGPGALPTAAARICATAAAALPPPLSANGHRASPRPRRRPALARARSRTGPPGAEPGVRPVCVRACVRRGPRRRRLAAARRPSSSATASAAAGHVGKWSPARWRRPRPEEESARIEPRACACCERACVRGGAGRVRGRALGARHRGAQARLRLPCSVSSAGRGHAWGQPWEEATPAPRRAAGRFGATFGSCASTAPAAPRRRYRRSERLIHLPKVT